MGAKTGVHPKGSVGEAVAAYAANILADGRAAIDAPDRADAIAVHEFRKTMKRWRAFLRLLERPFGEDVRRLRLAARDLARELAAARDGQSALDALADLGKQEQRLPERSVAAIAARLEAIRRDAESTALTPAMRARMQAAIDDAQQGLQQWPLDELHFSDLATGLAQGYRRARRSVPAQWPEANSEELHELRGRVVVHRYQMEVVEPLWPRFGKVWIGEAQRLRERLGTCQDLAVLGALTAPHGPLAPWRSRLTPLIAARQATHVAAAARIAQRLFAERPRAFRRRLIALWDGSK